MEQTKSQGMDTPFGKCVGARSHAITPRKHAHGARLCVSYDYGSGGALVICSPLDLAEMNNEEKERVSSVTQAPKQTSGVAN
jgi:hypothetical protein